MMRVDDDSVAVLHPSGNENVRQLLTHLQVHGLLHSYGTSFGIPLELIRCTRLPGAKSLRKRLYADTPRRRLKNYPLAEIGHRLAGQLGPPGRVIATSRSSKLTMAGVSRYVDHKFSQFISGNDSIQVLFGYMTHMLQSALAAKASGKTVVLEAHHVHWRSVESALQSLAEVYPDWCTGQPMSLDQTPLAIRADSELALADIVLAPSAQVADSLSATQTTARIVNAPYGCPKSPQGIRPVEWSGREPLRLLFVGRLDPLKGIAAMADAVENLPSDVTLTIIGRRPQHPPDNLARLLRRVNYLGSLPRAEVLEHMRGHHAFLLPSIVEGRSLAGTEAASAGLPLLVTPGSGVSDLTANGAGFTLSPNSATSILEAVEAIRSDPSSIGSMSRAVLRNAEHNSWARYAQNVLAALEGR